MTLVLLRELVTGGRVKLGVGMGLLLEWQPNDSTAKPAVDDIRVRLWHGEGVRVSQRGRESIYCLLRSNQVLWCRCARRETRGGAGHLPVAMLQPASGWETIQASDSVWPSSSSGECGPPAVRSLSHVVPSRVVV